MACTFADEAFHKAMDAAYAMERAAKVYGPTSDEARLARKGYEQHMEDYRELTARGKTCHCEVPCCCWAGNKIYDC
jgi:hypothetical protein